RALPSTSYGAGGFTVGVDVPVTADTVSVAGSASAPAGTVTLTAPTWAVPPAGSSFGPLTFGLVHAAASSMTTRHPAAARNLIDTAPPTTRPGTAGGRPPIRRFRGRLSTARDRRSSHRRSRRPAAVPGR